jgi:hypothetical protein
MAILKKKKKIQEVERERERERALGGVRALKRERGEREKR